MHPPQVAAFINASSSREVVFTRGASEAINLVAQTWGYTHLKEGDEIVLSVLEHHSNLVPWQMVAQRTGAVLKFVELGPNEAPTADGFRAAITPKTRLVATAHVSNTLGVHCPHHIAAANPAARFTGASLQPAAVLCSRRSISLVRPRLSRLRRARRGDR